ncbi:hypothetical protein [Roseibium alexandrii]|uniref:hypothetical protein n=1 Tax=Roseibium alexandrii TaxID=388408 RepID=UPI003753C8C9
MALSRQVSATVATKILGLVAFLCFGLVVVAAVSVYQMAMIGKELTNIAEKDIPLTTAISHVTNHQLEQAALVERLSCGFPAWKLAKRNTQLAMSKLQS